MPFNLRGSIPTDTRRVQHDFETQAGQLIWLQVCSAQLDQLTDPRLVLFRVKVDAQGQEQLQQLLEQDDAPNAGGGAITLVERDPYVAFQLPEAGRYRVVLLDNDSGARPGDALGYLLSVHSPQPAYDLVAYRPFPSNNAAAFKAIASNLMRGGAETIHVIAARQEGFGEAIEVTATDLPTGVSCIPSIIPAGATDASLTLVSQEDAPAWSGSIRVHGRSLGPAAIERTAHAAAITRGKEPTHNTIAASLVADLDLHVSDADTAPIGVKLGSDQIIAMARGGKLGFPIQLAVPPGWSRSVRMSPPTASS